MDSRNLWGDLPNVEDAGRSPKTILEEQANYLSEGTSHVLRGKVETTTTADIYKQIIHQFSIVAPFLNGYEVLIVSAYHDAETYPVSLDDEINNVARTECSNQEAFEIALEKVLTSKKVRSVINSLLSQGPKSPPLPTKRERW